MEVGISNSEKEKKKNSNIANTTKVNTNNNKNANILLSENYQRFISIIHFIIGAIFLLYLFSFVCSVYVRYLSLYFL